MKYFHGILNKYNDKLRELDVDVSKGISQREKEAKKLIESAEKDFKKLSNEDLLIIKFDDEFYKPKKIVAFNCFKVCYLHNGYSSQLSVEVFDILARKLIDVGMNKNGNILFGFKKNAKFIEVINKLYE